MSLFLGKIHYWLYNKILWFEKIEEEILRWAKEQDLPADHWLRRIREEFGEPTGGRPLEEIVDTTNIHGWLQDAISRAESRQAILVTEILKANPAFKEALMGIFIRQGEAAAREYGVKPETPEMVFNAVNDFILEGMPCDRVNEVVASSGEEFIWKATQCLHKRYWERIQGNVGNFYELREAWIKAFIASLAPEFQYEKQTENIYRIARRSK